MEAGSKPRVCDPPIPEKPQENSMLIRPHLHIASMAFLATFLASSLSWAQQMPSTPQTTSTEKAARVAPAPMTPAEIEEQQKLAIESYEAGEYLKFVQATMRLRNARPYEPQYMAGMVVGSAKVGRPKSAYSYMHKMQQQGLAYDFDQTADTESIRGTEVYDYMNSLLVNAGNPSGEGQVAFDLPRSESYPEALAWDGSAGRFLVGLQEGGTILAVSPEGEVSTLLESTAENGLRAIYGLAVDAERKRLWVSSAATPAFGKLAEGELGQTALLEFDLGSLQLLNRFEPPADQFPHLLASLDVTPEGDVIVMDRAVPMIFVKPAAGNSLSLLLSNFELTGLRDIALSDDGTHLYAADAALGILAVDLDKSSVSMLAGPEALNLGGISGIDYARGKLFMLQNGIEPRRLMRLELDATGNNVVNIVPLASNLEEYELPSFARVQGDDVFYFAGSNMAGERKKKISPVVMRTPVEPPKDQLTPEQQLFEDMSRQGKQPDSPAQQP